MAIIPRSKGHSFEMGFKIRRRFGVWTYIYAYMRVSTCLETSIHVNHIYTCIFIHAYARYVSLLDPQGIPTCKAPRKSDPGVPWRQCHDLGDRGPKDDRDDRGVPGTWTHKKLVTFRIQKNLKPSQNGGWISLNPILWCKPMAVLLTPISRRKKNWQVKLQSALPGLLFWTMVFSRDALSSRYQCGSMASNKVLALANHGPLPTHIHAVNPRIKNLQLHKGRRYDNKRNHKPIIWGWVLPSI